MIVSMTVKKLRGGLRKGLFGDLLAMVVARCVVPMVGGIESFGEPRYVNGITMLIALNMLHHDLVGDRRKLGRQKPDEGGAGKPLPSMFQNSLPPTHGRNETQVEFLVNTHRVERSSILSKSRIQ